MSLPLVAVRPSGPPPGVRLRPIVRAFPGLSAATAVHLVLVGVALVGLAVDPRELGGAPLWVKPFKFAVSGALYAGTLAVLLLPLRGRRAARVVDGVAGFILVAESVAIAVQAGRGVASHFNVSTPVDIAVFSAMGVAITALVVLTLGAAVMLARAPAVDPLAKQAALWGLALAIAGASVGFLMTQPTPAQIDAMQAAPPTAIGAHTVGAPDGGPGLPLTAWSTAAGDLRVPHFWGLHALQALPLLAFWLRRRRRVAEPARRRLVTAAGLGWGGVFSVLLWQALRGQSVVAPDAWTLAALAVVALVAGLVVRSARVGDHGR